MCVCAREKEGERERECVSERVCVRERGKERECVCVPQERHHDLRGHPPI